MSESDPSETLVVRRNDMYPRSIPAPYQSARFCHYDAMPSPEPGVGHEATRISRCARRCGGVAARGAGADQRKKIPRTGLLWHEASTEEAVIYLGADLSCRQNATHSRDIDWLLNHPLGRPCPYGFYPGSLEPLVKLVARSLARWSSREPPFKGTRAE